MFKRAIATALLLASSAAFGQSTTDMMIADPANATPGPGNAGGLYGPPAPAKAASPKPADVATVQPTTDAPQQTAKHRGRHRGGYAEGDSGLGR